MSDLRNLSWRYIRQGLDIGRAYRAQTGTQPHLFKCKRARRKLRAVYGRAGKVFMRLQNKQLDFNQRGWK